MTFIYPRSNILKKKKILEKGDDLILDIILTPVFMRKELVWFVMLRFCTKYNYHPPYIVFSGKAVSDKKRNKWTKLIMCCLLIFNQDKDIPE